MYDHCLGQTHTHTRSQKHTNTAVVASSGIHMFQISINMTIKAFLFYSICHLFFNALLSIISLVDMCVAYGITVTMFTQFCIGRLNINIKKKFTPNID